MTSSNEQVVNVENDFTAASYLGRLCNFTMPQAAAGAIIHPNNAPPQASDANNDKNNNKNNKGCMRLYPISDIPKQKPKKPVWLLRRTCAIMDDQNSPACGEEGCDTKAHALWKPEEDFDDDNEDDASSTTCRFLCMDCQMRVMFGFSEVEPVPLVAAPLRKPYPGEIERQKRERKQILDEQQRKVKHVRFEQQNRIEEENEDAENTVHDNIVHNGAEMGTSDTEDMGRNGKQAEESNNGETTSVEQVDTEVIEELHDVTRLESSKLSSGGDNDDNGDDSHIITIKGSTHNKESEHKKTRARKKRVKRKDEGEESDDASTQSMEYSKELPQEHTNQWLEMFQQLCEYKRFTGNCLVPTSFENVQLSSWVSIQRQRYKQTRGYQYTDGQKYFSFTREEELRLRGIEFVFDASKLKGKRRNANATKYLEYWRSRNNKKASDDGLDANEDVADDEDASYTGDKFGENEGAPEDVSDDGGDEETNETESNRSSFKLWYDMYKELRRYKSEFGDCRVAQAYHGKQKRCLGQWVNSQRRRCKSKIITDKEKSLLDDIGFIWVAKKYDNRRQKAGKSESTGAF